MDKNRKLKRLVSIVIIIALFIVAVFGIAIYKRSKSNNVKEEIDTTTIYANLNKFAIDMRETSVSDLGKAYMESAKFEIVEWDEHSMKGKIKLRVPDVYDIMVKTVEEFNSEYSSIEDNSVDLESILKERLILAIENTDKVREKEMEVDLTEYEGEIYIVPSKEIFNYIYEDFLRISIEMQADVLGGEGNDEN